MAVNRKLIDLSARRFGSLVVLHRLGAEPHRQSHSQYWICRCNCGAWRRVRSDRLVNGEINSCRACKISLRKLAPAEHLAWSSMQQRCYNKNSPLYKYYGARGIKICRRWQQSFQQFLADMGPKPTGARYSIDRIDNDGNYEPGNCRWATHSQQMSNRQRAYYVERDGVRRPLHLVAKELGIPWHIVVRRLYDGWSVDEALKMPPHARRFVPNTEEEKWWYAQTDLGYKLRRREAYLRKRDA